MLHSLHMNARSSAVAAVLALSIVAPGSGLAQTFPTQQVRIVVPFPPGGTTDILARDLAQTLTEKWGVSVLVDNRAGASGTIGSEQVVRAAPDGHTLLLTATHHVINPSLYASLKYDARKDFTSIAQIASVPNVLVVNPSTPAKTVDELIALAKAKPGAINFGSSGPGGANHLSGELFKYTAGIDITHIPYKGAAPALNDLLGGHIPMMFDSLPGVIQHIRNGKLRALAVTSKTRAKAAPEIPTMQEAGVREFEATAWFGLYAPAGLPAQVTRKLSTDVLDALGSPRIQALFTKIGADPGTMSQPEFTTFVDVELTRWNKVITAAGVKLN